MGYESEIDRDKENENKKVSESERESERENENASEKEGKLSRERVVNTILAVLIVGVIATLAVSFALSLLLDPSGTMNRKYFDDAKVKRSVFSSFDDACLKNKTFASKIYVAEYRIFGNTFGNRVIGGKNGFLFMAGKNKFGYDYTADYVGENLLSQSTLESFYQHLEMRRLAYQNNGCTYLLAVIPNAQTVYSENMPDCYGSISQNTMLLQLQAYLEYKGFDAFLNLSEPLQAVKSHGLLYNNTENTLNALGAYYAYAAAVRAIPGNPVPPERISDVSEYSMYTHYTMGKTAAALAHIEATLPNETISLSEFNKYKYTTLELFGDLETTYTKLEYRKEIPLEPSVLLEVTQEWDKIQLMPYFSNTFGVTSYRTSHVFNRAVFENADPDIVIQFIHEDELYSLIRDPMASSYDEGLNPGQNPYSTATPRDVLCTQMTENTVCVTGIVESGAEVTLFGESIKNLSVKEFDGRFFAVVTVEDGITDVEIAVSAKAEGKNRSGLVTLQTKMVPNVSEKTALVGENSILYRSSYFQTRIPDAAQIQYFNRRLADQTEFLMKSSSNEKTRVIHCIFPEKLSVYRNGLPQTLTEQLQDLETIRSLYRLSVAGAGATVLDFTNKLRECSADYKLFMQTSDLYTDAAYYFIYAGLMAEIQKDFPELTVQPIEKYKTQIFNTSGGALSTAVGFPSGSVAEKNVRFSALDGLLSYYDKTLGALIRSKQFVTHSDPGLPVAVVVRDAGLTRTLDLMARHFSTMYVLEEGQTEIPAEVLQTLSPDYIIYLTMESSINYFGE